MRSPDQFAQTVRHGVRCGRPSVVVHAYQQTDDQLAPGTPRVGFIVSKKIGNAVTRNRVKRRLRHLARSQAAVTPDGVCIVVRALPPAVSEPERLALDLGEAWHASLRRLGVIG